MRRSAPSKVCSANDAIDVGVAGAVTSSALPPCSTLREAWAGPWRSGLAMLAMRARD
jgi:hypothetical protein